MEREYDETKNSYTVLNKDLIQKSEQMEVKILDLKDKLEKTKHMIIALSCLSLFCL